MKWRAHHSIQGFTLVELMVSMSLAMIVMAAVFSTYLYLGRNLTRLSFRSTQESQSRKILNSLASDLRNTITVKAGSSPSSTSLSLVVMNTDPSDGNTDISKGPVPTFDITYNYDATSQILSRNTTAHPLLVIQNGAMRDTSASVPVPVPVLMPSFSFLYYTTSGAIVSSQFSSPAPPIPPISIKQIAVQFTLQPVGDPTVLAQSGILSTYSIASGRMPLINRPLPNGS